MQTPSTSSSFNIREDNSQSSSSHDDGSVSGSIEPAHNSSDTIQEDNRQSSSSHDDDDSVSGSVDPAHDCSLSSDTNQEDNRQSSSSHDDDSVLGSVDPAHDCSLPSDIIQEDNRQSSYSHHDDSVSGSVIDPAHDCSLPSDTITPYLSTTSICHSQSVSGGMHILDEEAQSTYVQSSHAFQSAQSLSCGLSQSFSEGMQLLQTYNESAQSPSTYSALEYISPRSLLVSTRSLSSVAVISQPLLSRNSLQPIETPITKLPLDWDDDTDSEVVISPQPAMLLDISKSTSLPLPCFDVSVQLHSQSQLVIAHPFSPANNAGIAGCPTTGQVKPFVFQFKVGNLLYLSFISCMYVLIQLISILTGDLPFSLAEFETSMTGRGKNKDLVVVTMSNGLLRVQRNKLV